ncbi:hypothetical protein NXS19_000539 [Fusarium pseudograminearum]|nr:hypothetical protein NXS19_000539 [Fusarium pseudograminearum]
MSPISQPLISARKEQEQRTPEFFLSHTRKTTHLLILTITTTHISSPLPNPLSHALSPITLHQPNDTAPR